MITDAQLGAIMPRMGGPLRALWLGPLNAAMAEFGLHTPLRMAMFLAQVAHESAELTRLEENLNYSAAGLLKTWPSRFTSGQAQDYQRQPQRIANRVYGARVGNGPESSGHGWMYRGRGPIQITFLGNYRECGEALRLDLVAEPGLLIQPWCGARSAAWFFVDKANGIVLADKGDIVTCSRRINGGAHGLSERTAYYRRALEVLGG